MNRRQRSLRATFMGLAVNAVLTGAKFTAGIVGHSHALVADADLDDALDENAGGMDVVGIDLAGRHQVLDLGQRHYPASLSLAKLLAEAERSLGAK